MINICMVELDEPLKDLDTEVQFLSQALQKANFACKVYKSLGRVLVDVCNCTHPGDSLMSALDSQGVKCIVYVWEDWVDGDSPAGYSLFEE